MRACAVRVTFDPPFFILCSALFLQLPPVTRTYVTLCILTTAACALEVSRERRDRGERAAKWFFETRALNKTPPPPFPSFSQLIAPFNIYYNARLIFQKGEVWRLLTCFLYFGSLS